MKIVYFCVVIFLLLNTRTCLEPAKYKFFVFRDPETQGQLLVEGQQVENGEFFFDDDDNALAQIVIDGEIVFESRVEIGSYAVNLSPKHKFSFEEIVYGGYSLSARRKGNIDGVGIEKLSDRVSQKIIPFNEQPPLEVREKAGSEIADRTYFNLKVAERK